MLACQTSKKAPNLVVRFVGDVNKNANVFCVFQSFCVNVLMTFYLYDQVASYPDKGVGKCSERVVDLNISLCW